MKKPAPGKEFVFTMPTEVTVLFPGGATFGFKGVSKLLEETDGTLWLYKINNNFVKIKPGYMFYEAGEVEDDEQ